MMNLADILLLSVALAMDCFTVSIVSGVILRRRWWSLILWIALLFGFFQLLSQQPIGCIFLLVGSQQCLVFSHNVQDAQLEIFLSQQQVLVLGVYVNELFANFLQLCQ